MSPPPLCSISGSAACVQYEQAEQVDREHPAPFLGVRFGDRPEQHHARVVDEEVQPTELVVGALDELTRLRLVGDIGLQPRGSGPWSCSAIAVSLSTRRAASATDAPASASARTRWPRQSRPRRP